MTLENVILGIKNIILFSVIFYSKISYGDANLIVFPEKTRYFPEIIYQYTSPEFIWEDFNKYNMEIWGDNVNGNINISKSNNTYTDHITNKELINNELVLKNKEMIWLLSRLSYGQLEFRWSSIGSPKKGEDKYIGFGDPNEGYAVGYRIYDRGGSEGIGMYAVIINHGQLQYHKIKWSESYINSRFIISWEKNRVQFIIITPETMNVVYELYDKNIGMNEKVLIPKVRLEISAQNISGKENIHLDLIKYDKY
ncbi:hypothetical protein G6646_00200 [Polynucleobacter paneuropaeus]|nr:hypothetical protein [Polynucleobacter paneuropaeus]